MPSAIDLSTTSDPGLFDAYALLRDEKSSGTDGGTFTSGAWQTRTLNTEAHDPAGIVAVSSNQFTLQPGTYYIRARAPAYRVSQHKAKLYNVTAAADVTLGTSEYSNSGSDYAETHSQVDARVTISVATAFEIRHQCATTRSTNGFGVGVTLGTEVFTTVEIWREGTPAGRAGTTIVGLFDTYALLRDEKAANTAGGTFTSGAWRTRDLNTESFDPDGIVSLSSNQFTLEPGTYLIRARAPAFNTARHKVKLYNVTDAADVAFGSSAYSRDTDTAETDSVVVARVTIGAAKTFEIRHQAQTTATTNGLGLQSNLGVIEVYTEVEIWREAGRAVAATTGGWVAAGETWTYASADDPTFTFTVNGDVSSKYSAGMRIQLVQTTTKYFLITKVAYSSGTTTITVYGGSDYDLANAAITSPYYSTHKAPAGFPLDPTKWTETVISSTAHSSQSSPAGNTWYNLGSLSGSIPIGVWHVSYMLGFRANVSAEYCGVTLSTANNSESDNELTAIELTTNDAAHPVHREKVIALTAKTTHYLLARSYTGGTGTALGFRGDVTKTLVRARSAYL